MYLYFNKNGTLKEIINDDALRQGNYGVNKMYVYIDRWENGATDVQSINVEYLLPSGSVVVIPDVFTIEANAESIPFDPKRDLRYFKYNQTYKFFIIDLSAGDSQEEGVIGNTALDETGVVHCNMTMNLTGGDQYALGDVNFMVQNNASLNQKYVASEQYMSLADYLYLKKYVVSGYIPYTGASGDVNLGNHALNIAGLSIESVSDGEYEIGANYQDSLDLSFGSVTINNVEVATQTWVGNNYLPAGSDINLGQHSLRTWSIEIGSDGSISATGEDLVIESNQDCDIHIDPWQGNKAYYNGSEIVTIAWINDYILSKHNGIYTMSSAFFPDIEVGEEETLTVDLDVLKDIVENGNALVESVTLNSNNVTRRYNIVNAVLAVDSTSHDVTSLQLIYEFRVPNNVSANSYVSTSIVYKVSYSSLTQTTKITKLADVDNG